jgi:hypothetical protein
MITIKQLTKHLSSNTLTEEEIEKLLQTLYSQTYEFAVQQTHNKLNHLKHKRRDAVNFRMKKEWDTIITKLRDKLNK